MTDTNITTESNIVPIRPRIKPREATPEAASRMALVALLPRNHAVSSKKRKRMAEACHNIVQEAMLTLVDIGAQRSVESEIARAASGVLAKRCSICRACSSWGK